MARYLHFSRSDLDEMDDEDLADWIQRMNELSAVEKKAHGLNNG